MPTDDYTKHMAGVAQRLLGKPNKGSTKSSWRYGSKGSLSIDPIKGVYTDWETKAAGGVLDLIHRETGLDLAGCHDWLRSNGFEIGNDKPRGNGKSHANGAAKPNGHANGQTKPGPMLA